MNKRGKYCSFAALASRELDGRDFKRIVKKEHSNIVVIAPHGGGIEPGTSEVAEALAGSEFSMYCFEAIRLSGCRDLYVSSVCFDEPMCVQLVESSEVVVAIHGCMGQHKVSYIGGIDESLVTSTIGALRSAGFSAERGLGQYSGRDRRNICNKGNSGKGLQIEIPNGLRRQMFEEFGRFGRRKTTLVFDEYIAAVRCVLLREECRAA